MEFGAEITGLEETISFLKRSVKAVDWANAKAANDLAVLIQTNTVENLLPKKFTLRTKWFQPRTRLGFNIQFANPNRPEAIIGSRAPWLKLQEEGGTKSPHSTKNLSIPMKGARPTDASLIAKEDRPRSLFRGKKSKAFVVNTASGPIIFVRKNKFETIPYYSLKASAKVKPILEFIKTGNDLVSSQYQSVYQAAWVFSLEHAI